MTYKTLPYVTCYFYFNYKTQKKNDAMRRASGMCNAVTEDCMCDKKSIKLYLDKSNLK